MAAEGERTAVSLQGEFGFEVDGEASRLVGSGVAELCGDEGPEDIFVVEGVRISEKPFGCRLVAVAGAAETLHAPERKPSVAHPVEEVASEDSAAACQPAAQPEPETAPRTLVEGFAGPGGTHAVVSAAAPHLQFVAEDPDVGLADQDVLAVGEEVVEGPREHHAVVACDAVPRAEPFVRYADRLQPGRFGRERHPLGAEYCDGVAPQLLQVVPQRTPLVRGQRLAVNGDDDLYFRSHAVSFSGSRPRWAR